MTVGMTQGIIMTLRRKRAPGGSVFRMRASAMLTRKVSPTVQNTNRPVIRMADCSFPAFHSLV